MGGGGGGGRHIRDEETDKETLRNRKAKADSVTQRGRREKEISEKEWGIYTQQQNNKGVCLFIREIGLK